MASLDLAKCNFDTCPIETSYYGYQPNLGIDAFLLAVYALAILTCVVAIFSKRHWLTYSIVVVIGSVLELIGYACRIIDYSNPWDLTGFTLQYVFLTIAPVFMTAAIYVSIGYLALTIGRGAFGIEAKYYARVFISSDVIALVIQATGGALSTSETQNSDTDGMVPGTKITIAGLVIQVISLTVFLVLFCGILVPSRIWSSSPRIQEGFTNVEGKRGEKGIQRLRWFVCAMLVATLLVLLRSAYRVAELSKGLNDGLAQNQWLFIGLDGLLIATATAVMVVFHPVFLKMERSQ